ncbi:MAG: hypothetical protein HQK50_14940 [Oligoflexia bacterium]|nr:hypothetical protein [Oligoflexia bacterium]MBF0366868.1 hypothetical protein [Oligoflexia bacterium]
MIGCNFQRRKARSFVSYAGWVLLVFIIATNVARADHSENEFRLDLNHLSMVHVPVTEQNLGMCYAFASAQMLDAYRFSSGDQDYSKQIDPFALAVAFKQKNYNNDAYTYPKHLPPNNYQYGVTFGWVRGVLDVVNAEGGACLGNNEKIKTLAEEYKNNYSQIKKNELDQFITYFLNHHHDLFEGVEKSCSEFSEKEEHLQNAGIRFVNFFKAAIDQFCTSDERKNFSIKYDHIGPKHRKEFKNFIDSHLQMSKAQPVAVRYDCNVVYFGRKYPGIDPSLQQESLVDEKYPHQHVSLIIGYRMRVKTSLFGHEKKTRQYLVRNSWGIECGKYSKDWKCDNGNLWIDEEVLLKSINSLTTILPPP